MTKPKELETEVTELQRQLAQIDMLTNAIHRMDKDLLALLLLKRGNLKFKMYQELGHKLPHIHIDYGRKNHVASYTIDPTARLAGNLDRKYDRTVTEWISSRKKMLLELWIVVQAGSDESRFVIELAGDA
jgi:hypothetical protein